MDTKVVLKALKQVNKPIGVGSHEEEEDAKRRRKARQREQKQLVPNKKPSSKEKKGFLVRIFVGF